MVYLYLGGAIVSEVMGTLMLKQSYGGAVWQWGGAALACYAVAFVLLGLCLKLMSVGIAYAIWAGAGIGLVCLLSALIWGQRLDFPAAVGIACILAGVLLITLKSRAVLV